MSDTIVPLFGKWMSTKYNWTNEEIIIEQDLNKALTLINELYVQKT